jgi:hypothetical protein
VSEISVRLCDFEVELSPQLGLRVENEVLPLELARTLGCDENVRVSLFIDASDGGGLHDLIASAIDDEDDRSLFADGCIKIALGHCLVHARLDAQVLSLLVATALEGTSERVLSLDLSMMTPLADILDKTGAASLLPERLVPDAKGALFLPQIVLKVIE